MAQRTNGECAEELGGEGVPESHPLQQPPQRPAFRDSTLRCPMRLRDLQVASFGTTMRRMARASAPRICRCKIRPSSISQSHNRQNAGPERAFKSSGARRLVDRVSSPMSAFDQSGHSRCRPSASSKSGGWNHHPQRRRPQRSRQQLRPPPQPGPQPTPQPGAAPQAPQPGRQPGPHPGPQRSRPQRSRQHRRPHCTSIILSMPAVAAAGSGRIGAAWVVPEPPANTRPAIPTANSMRSIVCTRFFHG